ncbi:MAG: hypothetical protein Q8K74_10950 [Candidatus Nitrotoga sp.]|nr:hypothetical protein [Candidatus Nitrotoga sp.]MDO9447108.1 hypothetical protein [Candidatus Nitrotoga sp.]MDP1638559.1 hypothetical protein [Candidatus Nitrotoga sp.]MDP1856537.1 hypothetical protein [Candidatus Nitrotoga sp.]MDP3497421.1 hypothetical protein [Candidatus Nitrotoga sp.]
MNFKLISTKVAYVVLTFMMVNSGSVLAGTMTLIGVTGNTCPTYTGYSADASGNLTVTCSSETAETPTQAPSCTLTASPSTISAGTTSTLFASCSPAATSYEWNDTGFTGGSRTVNPTSTTTYSVAGINSVGKGNTASREITVTSANIGESGTRTVPPTSFAPLADIRTWNAAFEKRNNIPPNPKAEPVGYMAYLKLIQANKPTMIFLPLW